MIINKQLTNINVRKHNNGSHVEKHLNTYMLVADQSRTGTLTLEIAAN